MSKGLDSDILNVVYTTVEQAALETALAQFKLTLAGVWAGVEQPLVRLQLKRQIAKCVGFNDVFN